MSGDMSLNMLPTRLAKPIVIGAFVQNFAKETLEVISGKEPHSESEESHSESEENESREQHEKESPLVQNIKLKEKLN